MAKNLKQLLLRYYCYQRDVQKYTLQLEELQSKPLDYAGQTDVDELQHVLKYKTEIQNRYYTLKKVSDQIMKYNKELVDLLTMIGIPLNHKITLTDNGNTIHFWHDEDGYVDWEVVE